MRIGMLLMGGSFPPDLRVHKEAQVLLAAGHEISLLATDKDGGAAREDIDGIDVHRYPARTGALRSKLTAVGTLVAWRNAYWEQQIGAYVERIGADVIHVHDLPAVKSAVAVGRRRGIPVVFDMHENYSDAVKYWKRSWAAETFQTPGRYAEYEMWALDNADAIVVTIEEMRDRVAARGVDPRKLTVFSNVDDWDGSLMWSGSTDPYVVVYAGGFGEHRGIDTLIRAFAIARREIPGARLLIMGAGKGEEDLHSLAADLGLSAGDVEFTGWVSLGEMRERLAASSVGVVPHHRTVHTDSTIPHKLFQYMAMGLPTIVSDCRPLARIVSETGAGAVSRSGDPEDLARALVALSDPDAAAAASRAGVEATRTKYSLKAASRDLVRLYDRVAEGS